MNNRGGRTLELLELRSYGGEEYSNSELNAVLGAGDRVIVHAFLNGVTGTNPALVLKAEDSSDAENWANLGTVITTGTINAGSDIPSVWRGVVDFPHGRFLRLKTEISGTGAVSVTMNVRASIKNA